MRYLRCHLSRNTWEHLSRIRKRSTGWLLSERSRSSHNKNRKKLMKMSSQFRRKLCRQMTMMRLWKRSTQSWKTPGESKLLSATHNHWHLPKDWNLKNKRRYWSSNREFVMSWRKMRLIGISQRRKSIRI